jgi:pyridoxamine 5'-phosphate oxidase
MAKNMADMREAYDVPGLLDADVLADPFDMFDRWFDAATEAGIKEPNAMTLATVDGDGLPDARVVLLKGIDANHDGTKRLRFFSNYESSKAHQIEATPHAALVFYWDKLDRSVRIRGPVEKLSHTESETYFHSRPRGSQLGAWASHQSEVIEDRAILQQRETALSAKYDGLEIPMPPFWGGYVVTPLTMEFWQGQPSRLHDRVRYRRETSAWMRERLSP